MELRKISNDDLALYEAIHCDPRMMEHLGGPLPREGLKDKLQRDVASTEAGETWIYKIIPDEADGNPAGTVVIWQHHEHGAPINEIGWMVLPPYQGRGLGTEAVGAILDKARAEQRWEVIHAFPPVSNVPSNAMCRKMGFEKIETRDYKFRDRSLRCNHWRLDLRSAVPA